MRAAVVAVTRPWGVLLCVLVAAPARAEDKVEVHGSYFREASTRIIQPMLQLTKDLPLGFDVAAHGLVDAVTSASVAQGATQDDIFTETRKEAGLRAGKTFSWNRTRVGGVYRHSAEPDYGSHTLGVEASTGVWDQTGVLGARLARTSDTIGPNRNLALKTWFFGVGYEQPLSPTVVAQLVYEAFYQDGYLANVYLRVPNLGRERAPAERIRHATSLRLAKYFPSLGLGLQAAYRLYVDQDFGPRLEPWGLVAHTADARIFYAFTQNFEIRLGYRYHSQGAASFWCNTDPSRGGRTDCYGRFPAYASVDVKWGSLATHLPEMKLFYDLRRLGSVPGLRHFAAGTVHVSYGYMFQSSRYGGAHLLQSGYSYPF